MKALGRDIGPTRTAEQTALASFWTGDPTHWNEAANQMARANHLSMSDNNRLLAVLNVAMADTAFTTSSAKRFYGSVPFEVTWRPVTSIPLADTDKNPNTVLERRDRSRTAFYIPRARQSRNLASDGRDPE